MQPDRFIGTQPAIADRIATLVAQSGAEAIRVRGVFSIAIPGGSVAEATFPRIARLPLEWAKVHIFWCDERAVPLDNPDSNAGAAFKLWHDTPLSRDARLHVMNGADRNVSAVALDYAAQLASIAGPVPKLDMVLLGVGEEGHVASLFPGHASLDETARTVLLETNAPKPPANRFSLTLPVLCNARDVIIAAFGAGKANAMQDALENTSSALPVARVLQRAAHVHVMLDDAAASRLTHATLVDSSVNAASVFANTTSAQPTTTSPDKQ